MVGASLEVAQRTDPGRDPNKQQNEDAAGYLATQLGQLLVVCDGMGGHALGQEASQLAVSTIMRMVDTAPASAPPGSTLLSAVVQAGRAVYQMGGIGQQAGRPGSTCVAVLVHDGTAEIAHVGDSRVYFMRRGQIWQMTRDHSVVQQLVDRGVITPEQAVGHPEANKITRALGMKLETDVELREPPVPLSWNDIFILASDGLCDLVRMDEIGLVISQTATLELACEELVRLANSRGGHDNITVQIARILKPPGDASAALPDAGPAPTLVDASGVIPDKTLVDLGPTPTAPFLAASPPLAPPPLAAPPALHVVSEPAPSRPGVPPRGGCLVLLLAMALMGIILTGVVVWWIFWRPR